MISFYNFGTMKSQEAKLIPFTAEMFVEVYVLRHYGEGNRMVQTKSRCLWEYKITHTCDVIARDVSNQLAEAHSSRLCHRVVGEGFQEVSTKYRLFTDFAQLRNCPAGHSSQHNITQHGMLLQHPTCTTKLICDYF